MQRGSLKKEAITLQDGVHAKFVRSLSRSGSSRGGADSRALAPSTWQEQLAADDFVRHRVTSEMAMVRPKTPCNDDARPMAVLVSIANPERFVDDKCRSKLFLDRPSDV